MVEKTVTFSERLFFMMVWVVIVIILAGFVLQAAKHYGILPGVAAWIGQHANLSAQAGV